MFKQCFKSLERSVIHKLTEGDSLPLKKAPNFKNTTLNNNYNNNLISNFYKLSNNLALLDDYKLISRLKPRNTFW